MERKSYGLSHEFHNEPLSSELEKVCAALEMPIIKMGVRIIAGDTLTGKYGYYYPQIGQLVKTVEAKNGRVL
ncbi:MAG: hypothetical protein K2G35_06535 [Duncaniella sp.]|nr:hypothetical protein [Duncaniella sp.]